MAKKKKATSKKKTLDKRSLRNTPAHKKLQKKFNALKKKAKRKKAKNSSLDPKYHNLAIHEYLDYDYVKELGDKEKEWLNKFSEEYYRAYFNSDAPKHLHKKKHRKEIYGSNNARNRCIVSRSKKYLNLDYIEAEEALALNGKAKTHGRDVEEAVVEYIDAKRDYLDSSED